MMHINQEKDDLISKNVAFMREAGMDVLIETIGYNLDITYWEKIGWVFDDALYEKLQIYYSEKTNRFLTWWV